MHISVICACPSLDANDGHTPVKILRLYRSWLSKLVQFSFEIIVFYPNFQAWCGCLQVRATSGTRTCLSFDHSCCKSETLCSEKRSKNHLKRCLETLNTTDPTKRNYNYSTTSRISCESTASSPQMHRNQGKCDVAMPYIWIYI